MRTGGAAPSFPLFVHSVMHREHGLFLYLERRDAEFEQVAEVLCVYRDPVSIALCTAEHGLCQTSTAREKPARILPCLANQSALRQPIGAGDFESLVRKPMPPGQHIRPERRCRFRDRHAEEYAEAPLDRHSGLFGF